MKFDDIHIAIISHKRVDNIKKMEDVTEVPSFLNWYVGKGEAKDYNQAKGNVYAAGDLCHSRNMALDDAFNQNKYCLMLDDDLVKCQLLNVMSVPQTVTFERLVMEMVDVLSQTPLHLAGIAPTTNPFFYNPGMPLGLKHFIIGAMTLTKSTDIRFDPKLRTKEDYDITLQHVKKYGGVCRLNYAIPKFLHWNNAGGVVDYRTDEVEQASIAYLKKKWGGAIRDNKKRPNEILLKL